MGMSMGMNTCLGMGLGMRATWTRVPAMGRGVWRCSPSGIGLQRRVAASGCSLAVARPTHLASCPGWARRRVCPRRAARRPRTARAAPPSRSPPAHGCVSSPGACRPARARRRPRGRAGGSLGPRRSRPTRTRRRRRGSPAASRSPARPRVDPSRHASTSPRKARSAARGAPPRGAAAQRCAAHGGAGAAAIRPPPQRVRPRRRRRSSGACSHARVGAREPCWRASAVLARDVSAVINGYHHVLRVRRSSARASPRWL